MFQFECVSASHIKGTPVNCSLSKDSEGIRGLTGAPCSWAEIFGSVILISGHC